jgi:hypothetical protein
MGLRHRLKRFARSAAHVGLVGLAAAAAAGASGCKRREDAPQRRADVVPSSRPDTLAPGDLAEGPIDLYGLRTPLDSRVAGRLGTITIVRTALLPSELERFVAARVEGEVGWQDGTRIWKAAKVKASKDPAQRLQLTVSRSKDKDWKSELLVDLLAKDTMTSAATQEDRWKAVGVSPTGQLVNPNRE